MKIFNPEELKKLHKPSPASHKGDNGKVMIIAGSTLFHAASLWPLEIASRIVDMVFYSSVEENNQIVREIKKDWTSGIVVARNNVDSYIEEADAILIGPGLPREDGIEKNDDDTKELTERLLTKYPEKKWVIDGGSLQVMNPDLIPDNAILTPHHKEFEKLFGKEKEGSVAKKYQCTILLKGQEDMVCSKDLCVAIPGGNAGMTKGGTGDVLAGLAVALFAKNDDPLLVASASSYINKKAGDALYKKAGPYFNANDLVAEIPRVMKELLF